jgi:hypothetical protein
MAAAGEKNEILDDIKIDSLKTEIELTFTRTLLLELTQLNKRLQGCKDNPPRTEAGNAAAFKSGMNEDATGAGHIEKRIAKLEAILYNLGKKMDADISDLQTRLSSLKRPGLTGLLTNKGRIYRMLSAELKAKYAVLNSIRTKVPPSTLHRFFMPSALAAIAVFAVIIIWLVFSAPQDRKTVSDAPARDLRTSDLQKKAISRSDILSLLEDIRTANLRKDPSLWESRYSRKYLAIRGKKVNIQGLWNNFDYISLDYRMDQLNIRPDTATARITWDMELRSKKTGKTIRKTQTLSSDFIREGNTFKISAVRNEGL